MLDPNNPISKLRNNYYINNYGVVQQEYKELNSKLKRFPLFGLINELKKENFHDYYSKEPNSLYFKWLKPQKIINNECISWSNNLSLNFNDY